MKSIGFVTSVTITTAISASAALAEGWLHEHSNQVFLQAQGKNVGAIRPGVIWNATGRAPVALFEIITESGNDYFIKLVDLETGTDAVGIFVPGGQTVEAYVPLGNYEMRYAAGTNWVDYETFFGAETEFFVSGEDWPFTEVGAGWTVEMFSSYDLEGQAWTNQEISPADF